MQDINRENSTKDENFGERLHKLRTAKGLSQSELAALIGYKRSGSISNIEKNKTSPDTKTLSRIAECLNANLHWLIIGKLSPDGESWRESYAELFRMYSSEGGWWIDRLRGEIANLNKEIFDLREKESRGETINHITLELKNEAIREKQSKLNQIKDHLQRAIDRLGGVRIEY